MSPDVTVLYDTIRWEEKALIEAGKKSGISVSMVDCKKLALDLEKAPQEYGTVIQRCVSYYRNLHSTAALEGMGVRVINCLDTGILAGNKLFTHMLLKKANVPTPHATVAFSKDAAMQALESCGYPRVIKPTVGSWGRLISKLNDRDAAEGIIEGRESMYPIYQIHYLEEFVKRPPRDIRAIMVGDRIVAAIYRKSDHWKTNMALGGVAEKCDVTKEMEEMCIKAKNAVHGDIVGVDLMESEERGLVVHEVNNTTEYKNTVRVCGIDIPSLMLEYAVGRN
ncbi:MAG: lysine biosynthesis protein LysX [Nitrosopumilus sp. H8]|nr:MAG: lysine biosynthesis protein LysX [Nitrosopumilus sp. H13]RNJ78886.1 MAG: lysine biosynthesis protein LysX [Nitrosopumilus sp. H8]